MTYSELSKIKTTGFVTNNVIDDVVNNGRACYTKAAFKNAEVSEFEINKIKEWAEREGATFLSAECPNCGAKGLDECHNTEWPARFVERHEERAA